MALFWAAAAKANKVRMVHTKINKSRIASARGVTLIELVMVLVLIAILASLAAPSFMAFLDRTRVSNASHALMRAFAKARHDAVNLGDIVSICPSEDAKTCSNKWAGGWLIYRGELNAAPSEASVSFVYALSTKVQIKSSAKLASGLSYTSKGLATGRSGMANGTFTLCAGNSVRQIVLSVGGRASLRTPPVDAKINCEDDEP